MTDKMRTNSKSWDNFIHFCGGLGGIQIAGVKPGAGDDSALSHAPASRSRRDAACRRVRFLRRTGEIAIITHYGDEATMERFFRRPTMAICTDGLMPGSGRSRIRVP